MSGVEVGIGRKVWASPLHAVMAPVPAALLLILVTCLLRLAFGWALGLGVDESYMVAAGRQWRLGYFDHPPLAWWLTWGTEQIFGAGASPVLLRLPFILLFAVSTWLLIRLTTRLFDAEAAFWTAVLFNLAPVFGVASGGWVLPDGPLDAALLAAALALVRAWEDGRARWWLASGAAAGLALDAKYSAVLTLAGAAFFLATTAPGRAALRRWPVYAALALALLVFSPVLLWNAAHGWASFAFQGGRALGGVWHPLAPLTVLGGEALFLLPWIWLPLLVCAAGAARRGPREWRGWLLLSLAAPPILLFAAVALWARQKVLFHWAAPGYLFLLPLLGRAVARRLRAGERGVRVWLALSAGVMLIGLTLVGSEVRFDWLPHVFPALERGADPDLQAVDWTSLRDDLAQRRLLGPPPPVIAVLRWQDAGKLDYALAGAARVICLGPDPRQYGINGATTAAAGTDVLIVAPGMDLARIEAQIGADFATITPLAPLVLRHAGRAAAAIPLFLGKSYHAEPGVEKK